MFTLPETNGFSDPENGFLLEYFFVSFGGPFAYFQVQTAVSFRECIPHGKYLKVPAPLPCMSCWFDSWPPGPAPKNPPNLGVASNRHRSFHSLRCRC